MGDGKLLDISWPVREHLVYEASKIELNNRKAAAICTLCNIVDGEVWSPFLAFGR